jgi:hypothetical protein
MPREDGGGGMRDVGGVLPNGRGTTLTGLGATEGDAVGECGASTGGILARGSLSSPIETSGGAGWEPRPDFNPKRRYSRTIS